MNLDELSPQQLASILRSTAGTKDDPLPLPAPIINELEHLNEEDCATLVHKFPKALLYYEGQSWTQCGAINTIFMDRLKRFKMDGKQVVQAKYKDSERLRTAARATTELFEELEDIINNASTDVKEELVGFQEKIKQLAIYNFAAAKTIDIDAKAIAEKAIGLHTDRAVIDRDLAFSSEEVEKIQKKLFEQRLTSLAARQHSGNGFRGGRGYGRSRGVKSFPNRYTNRPWTNKFANNHSDNTTTSTSTNNQ